MGERVSVTAEAAALVRRLTETHGPVMFHQSGGCCDGSAPMCYPDGEFRLGGSDEVDHDEVAELGGLHVIGTGRHYADVPPIKGVVAGSHETVGLDVTVELTRLA